jgi:hypothetical protein
MAAQWISMLLSILVARKVICGIETCGTLFKLELYVKMGAYFMKFIYIYIYIYPFLKTLTPQSFGGTVSKLEAPNIWIRFNKSRKLGKN